MTKQNKGLKRDTVDKFYTKDRVVNICLEAVKTHITISDNDMVIEPSAGNGAFIPGIKKICQNYEFYDLEPENEEIIQQDFLTYHTTFGRNIHFIGNPPFGRNSSFAIQFIKKACQFGKSISFILPKSFKKESRYHYVPLCFHLIFELDLPKNSFLIDNNEHDVPCVFQIWERKKENRTVAPSVTAINFEFVKKRDKPHIAVKRVGGNAGEVIAGQSPIQKTSPQSTYYIKFHGIVFDDDLVNKLSNLTFPSRSYTAGPNSISKPELIKEFNKVTNE